MHSYRDLTLVANVTSQACIDAEDPPLKVLKFGGSVLRSVDDLPRVAGEIYRLVRDDIKVIAVVSALEGETDALFALAQRAGGGAVDGVADLVSLGEEKAAALLRIACGRVGLDAMIVRPEELCIHTSGDPLDADPEFIHAPALNRLVSLHDLLIMPGFVGLDGCGRRALLGRGGSDFSAIFLAGETGAALRLYKDVDGVYDHDPAADPENLQRYPRVSWQDCLSIARPLLQPRAVEYASSKRLRIEVGAIGSGNPTIVAATTSTTEPVKRLAPLRIGLAGFGAVGQALHQRLKAEAGFEIVAILVRDPDKQRRVSPYCRPTAETNAFFEAKFDVLVDATSGAEPGRALCIRHLAGMQDVVSANKAAIASNLRALYGLSRKWGGLLRYSAAVGGSAPMLELARRARGRGQVVEAAGILNGTINFVLDAMAGGATFEAALERAKAAGFAEADPAADMSGRDAAAKLRILAAEIWGEEGLDIPIDIEPLDAELATRISASAERWIQLAKLERCGERISGTVRFLPASAVAEIPPMPAEWNYLHLRLKSGETLSARGRGAGGSATAEAIMADLHDIAQLKGS